MHQLLKGSLLSLAQAATEHGQQVKPDIGVVAEAAAAFAASIAHDPHPERRDEVDERCRRLVRAMGETGLTRYCVRAADGGALLEFDARSICLVRETLAHTDGLADFAFAMQGLGSGAITLAGGEALRARYAGAGAGEDRQPPTGGQRLADGDEAPGRPQLAVPVRRRSQGDDRRAGWQQGLGAGQLGERPRTTGSRLAQGGKGGVARGGFTPAFVEH